MYRYQRWLVAALKRPYFKVTQSILCPKEIIFNVILLERSYLMSLVECTAMYPLYTLMYPDALVYKYKHSVKFCDSSLNLWGIESYVNGHSHFSAIRTKISTIFLQSELTVKPVIPVIPVTPVSDTSDRVSSVKEPIGFSRPPTIGLFQDHQQNHSETSDKDPW